MCTEKVPDDLLLAGMTVLVADDNATNRKLLLAVLTAWGCTVLTAVNGKDTIAKLNSNDCDMVLMDIQMPVMDGIEAARLIRTELKRDIPIIAVTTATGSGYKDTLIAAGMDDLITKPIDLIKVKTTIIAWRKTALERKGPARTCGAEPRKRILFIDDEADVLNGMRRLLVRLSGTWDMHFATSGQEALRLLAERHYDVLISDLCMPLMGGIELLALVKERYPRVARVVLSAHDDKEMLLRMVELTDQFIIKPCTPEALENALRKACREKHSCRLEDNK